MYVLKIKGTAGIPDFIQIRDANFFLVDYIKKENLQSKLKNIPIKTTASDFISKIESIPYGKLIKID